MSVESHSSNPRVHHGTVVREIYSRTPKWWARWTWPLLMGTTVWTAVGAETAFYHWTQRIDVASDALNPRGETDVVNSGASTKATWELRPLYQRVLMSGSILAFGTGLGILFLSTRSRIVRRLFLVSRPSPFQQNSNPPGKIAKEVRQPDFPYLLVETVANTSGKGKIFTKDDCKLSPGRDDSEMLLKVPGSRIFWLGLKGATIEGESALQDVNAVRQRLVAAWSGNKDNHNSGRWVRGPVVEGAS